MSLSKLFRPRTLAISIIILVLAVVAFGYAAANSVPESGAGDGDEIVSGYTITNISYQLDATDPSTVATLTMDIASTSGSAADPTDVRVTVVASPVTADWMDCVYTTTWTCTFTGTKPSVLDIVNLRVIAVQ